ncbi:MAG TPA: carbohydrate ABC transporter substrate-binding protein [Clostridiales bacterium]|nr:carbohydrate ABC transporter substrate-binding protein [Clostridiales bacterium]
MRRKVISIILLATLVFNMVGCGKAEPAKPQEPGQQQNTGNEAREDLDSGNGADTEDTKPFEGVTLSLMLTNTSGMEGLQAVIEKAEEKFGFKIELDNTGSGGTEYNSLVRTRLISGEMADILYYNAGAVLKKQHPEDYFMDLSGNKAIMERLDETFIKTVSVGKETYGVPVSSSQAGGILYNKAKYKELGLEVPHTWADFLANCEKAKEAGETAVISSFGSGWCQIVPSLGNYYNVHSAYPDFAERLEAGKAKFAELPEATKSISKCADLIPYINEDFMATTYDDACDRFAQGEGVHFIMLTQALSNIYSLYGKEVTDNIGVFGVPGDNPDDHGLTIWMPNCLYGNKDSKNKDAIMAFFEFYISDEALDTYASFSPPDGPYLVKGFEMPENVYPLVKEDMQAYFDAGKVYPAMEFEVSLEDGQFAALISELTLGVISTEKAAQTYDENLKQSAIQLGYQWD